MRNVHFWESPEILSSLKTWFRPRSHSRSQIYETQIYNSRFSNWLLITENANAEFHDCYFVGNLSERCFLIPVHSLDKVKFLSFIKTYSRPLVNQNQVLRERTQPSERIRQCGRLSWIWSNRIATMRVDCDGVWWQQHQTILWMMWVSSDIRTGPSKQKFDPFWNFLIHPHCDDDATEKLGDQ